MDREIRNLQHNKPERPNYSDRLPIEKDLRDGEQRYSTVSGVLRLYTKQRGKLYYVNFTGV